MRLINKTKGNTIEENIKTLDYFEKIRGLIGEDSPKAVYFKSRWGIHTAGMKFPIDVIILGKDMRVKKLKSNLKPGRFFFWNPLNKNVFEVPPGTILEKKIELNDFLNLL